MKLEEMLSGMTRIKTNLLRNKDNRSYRETVEPLFMEHIEEFLRMERLDLAEENLSWIGEYRISYPMPEVRPCNY